MKKLSYKSLAVLLGVLALSSCLGGGGGGTTSSGDSNAGSYSAEIRRTTYGIPHVKANDYGSLGYGLGYAFAEDNLCVLLDDLVTDRGERAKYFGPEGSYEIRANSTVTNNVDSDFFWRFVNTDDAIRPLKDGALPEAKAATRGYKDGINRYIRELKAGQHPGAHLACRDGAWLKEISEDDMYRRYRRLGLLASSSVFASGIATAAPPPIPPAGSSANSTNSASPSQDEVAAALARDPGPLAALTPEGRPIGSNMYALGSAATANGMPMVFGNPHFPWVGSERLYTAHGTIPGKLDIEGAALYGVPAVLIGFNRHFAWSHTVSTAYRFTFYELTLNPAKPTQYIYDGALRDMTAVPVTIQVKQSDGSLKDQTRTLYRSHYGPMLVFSTGGVPVLTWTNAKAYTLRDANGENNRLINQFFAWDKATSLDEFKSLHKSILGVPWVNTIASGPGGKAYYGDVTVVPNVPDDMVQTCAAHPLHDALQQVVPGLPVLDGSRAACEWRTDADAPAPGIFGPSHLPSIERDDWVANNNDSYWLTNPAQPLEGYARIIGAERTERSLRTRLSILQIQRGLANGGKFTLAGLKDTVLSGYILSGELARDSVVSNICPLGSVLTDSGPVDVSEACAVIASWDLHNNLDSKGAHVWREFWRRARVNPVSSLLPNPLLWTTPFSASDPVNTPSGLNPLNPQIQRALGQSVQAVKAAGFALDAPLRDMQHSGVIGDNIISIHGGEQFDGAFTIAGSGPISDKGYPVIFGNSYIQVVTWDPVSGNPIADGFVTYSQSTDPANAHYMDYTQAYSTKNWNRLPFTNAEITAAQQGPTLTISQ